LKKKKLLTKLANETPQQKESRYQKKQADLLKQQATLDKKIAKELSKKKQVDKIIKEPKKDKAGKSKHIKIYPNETQKNILKQWFGVRRWIYNKCLASFKEGNETITELRDKVINNKNFKDENTWMLDYHYDLRDEALRDLLKNIKSNKSKGVKFDIKFKSKKSMKYNTESLSVLNKYWNKPNNFYSGIFSPNKMRHSEKLPNKLKYDSRLLRTPLNEYYLSIPEPLETMDENQVHKSKSMIFIDPGVKTFITGYDPEGKVIHWGEGDIGRISRLLRYQSKLQKQMNEKENNKYKMYKRERRNTRNAMLRVFKKIKNLVRDLHKNLAKWLVTNYDCVFIPRLNFHKCKNLNKRSKRNLATFSHCAFLERLFDKTREFKNCKVIEVNESYTSKTCSKCGYQNETLRNKNVFNCNDCKLKIGRDSNAAKNIMLRYFTKRAIIS
jgi:IS605 OrfB family transposase